MSVNASLKVVVADSSVIIRSGLIAVLKRLPNLNVHPIEVTNTEALRNYLHLHKPDMIIINPTFDGWFEPAVFKAKHPDTSCKFIAFINSVISEQVLKEYDESISILDATEAIAAKINHLLREDEEEEDGSNETETLSQREKEIITCVVKGMTNKAIADQLFLSIHTVITHRRNIARKLQIHSPAGLTIYAIANKLVELKDIKDL